MHVSDDVEKYLKYYMDSICFLGKLQISAVKKIAQVRGQGAEYISCSFNDEDEDYKEGYVTLLFWKPAVEKDTMVFVNNSIFYEYLLKIAEECTKRDTQIKDELEGYLQQIKGGLKI